MDINGNNKLDLQEFFQFFNLLRNRPEIDNLFDQYSSNKLHLTDNELLNFYKTEQKVKRKF